MMIGHFAHLHKLFNQLTPQQAQSAATRFADDERDTMTPVAMVDLLMKIFTSRLLLPPSRNVMLTMMVCCQNGEGVLKRHAVSGRCVCS